MSSINKRINYGSNREKIGTTEDLLQALSQSQVPMSWRDLSVGLSSNERKALRNLLHSVEKEGQVLRDDRGHYHLDKQIETEVGLIERKGKALYINGLLIERITKGQKVLAREGDRAEVQRISGAEGESARLVKIVEYSKDPIVGEYREHARHPYVESLSPHYKGRISLTKASKKLKHGDTVEILITSQNTRGYIGELNNVISSGRGAKHAAESLITSFGIPVEWPKTVLDEISEISDVSDLESAKSSRRDLTSLSFITVDGKDAKDFDDALYAESLTDGWRLLVAIADVAHFVKADSELDKEALKRGNSVYLPDRVIPMLPQLLSTDLCSLRPKEERYSLVCDIEVSRSGEMKGFEFFEAKIQSAQRLTYEQLEVYLEENTTEEFVADILPSIGAMKDLLSSLLLERERRGALDFEPHEASLELAGDNLTALHPIKRLNSHRLVEEAMILANVCAANYLKELGTIYRVHETPKLEKINDLNQFFSANGITLEEPFSAAAINQGLGSLEDRPDKWLFELLVLRAMPQALYRADAHSHFGLALERYCHFTSPIRRYADLVVHRAIKAKLNGDDYAISGEQLAAIGEQISYIERRAEDLSYRVNSWLKCEYISTRIGDEFEGVVMGVTDFGLFIELNGYYVQGLLHVSELGEEFFHFQDSPMSLVAEGSGRRFGIGDVLSVQLMDVEPALGRLDLALGSSYKGNRKVATNKSGGPQAGDRPRRRRRGGRGRGRGRGKPKQNSESGSNSSSAKK